MKIKVIIYLITSSSLPLFWFRVYESLIKASASVSSPKLYNRFKSKHPTIKLTGIDGSTYLGVEA